MIELLPSGKSEGYEVCADDVALAVISPVAARISAWPGAGCQGCIAPPFSAASPCPPVPAMLFLRQAAGVYPPEPPPFPRMGKGVGFGLTYYIINWRFLQ